MCRCAAHLIDLFPINKNAAALAESTPHNTPDMGSTVYTAMQAVAACSSYQHSPNTLNTCAHQTHAHRRQFQRYVTKAHHATSWVKPSTLFVSIPHVKTQP